MGFPIAFPAKVFGAHRDENAELGRDDVKAISAILTDPGHLTAAARAKRAVGLDHRLNAGQVVRQISLCGLARFGLAGTFAGRFFGLFARGLEHALNHVDVFERQMCLIRVELLRFRPEPGMALVLEHAFKIGS